MNEFIIAEAKLLFQVVAPVDVSGKKSITASSYRHQNITTTSCMYYA